MFDLQTYPSALCVQGSAGAESKVWAVSQGGLPGCGSVQLQVSPAPPLGCAAYPSPPCLEVLLEEYNVAAHRLQGEATAPTLLVIGGGHLVGQSHPSLQLN